MQELNFDDLEQIEGGNIFDTVGKVGSAIGLVGSIGLAIAFPPTTVLGAVGVVAGIGATASGLFS